MTKPLAALPLFEILQTRLKVGGDLIKFQSVVPRHCVRQISKIFVIKVVWRREWRFVLHADRGAERGVDHA